MVLTPREMRAAEEAIFAQGVCAEALMEEAGEGIARAIHRFFPRPGRLVLYLGKGNNGGDALVAARRLVPLGWRVALRAVAPPEECSPLAARKQRQLLEETGLGSAVRLADACEVQLDGLLGIGASGPLRPELAALAREMNLRRRETGAFTVAVDIPSGLDGETGAPGPDTVEADFTFTVACAKTGLLADAAVSHVGRLECIPLQGLPGASFVPADPGLALLTPRLMMPWLPRRPFEFHKGQAGRVVVVAGSRGLTGAAVLAARGALAAGAGLVTLLTPETIYGVVAAAAPSEIMVRSWGEDLGATLASLPCDAVAAGPGLGPRLPDGLLGFLSGRPVPAVLDADLLNGLARAGAAALREVAEAGPRVATPHPGEFGRLAPDLAGWERRRAAEAFAGRFPLTLLLKGARTVIATAGRPAAFNATGDPGMASGGMGDVLTGVIAGWLGQGVGAHEAACLGAWLCGRSAECALVAEAASRESLAASHVLQFFGRACNALRDEAAGRR